MENDLEIKGNGNSYDFGARMYDPRVGRWFKSDPSEYKYPMYSTYSFVNNSPLVYIDPDGKEFVNPYKSDFNAAKQKLQNVNTEYQKLLEAHGGNLKAPEVRKYRKNELKAAQTSFNSVNKNYQAVERYLYTLKTINPEEYNYFDTLTDSEGNDVKINVFNEPKSEVISVGVKNVEGNGYARANTELEAKFSNPKYDKGNVDKNGHPVLINYTVSGVKENKIHVYLYEKTLSALANELGDIQYFFKNVKDKKTYEYFMLTANAHNQEYRNKDGSGIYSFLFEYMIKDIYDKYLKDNKSTMKEDDVNKSEQTINPPKDKTND